ncbi:hypothetical protein A2U01_0039830, partial [Trifolium medium]|nr:hypothetical protein [Trifolium medium]
MSTSLHSRNCDQFQGPSGVRALCDNADVLAGNEFSQRDEVEALRIMGLQEELGVKFHGGEGEDLKRAMELEVRDRRKKVEWEQQSAIQETKLEVISDSFCHGVWGNEDCDWIALPAIGNSGGILSVWDKGKASRVFHFSGE